LLPIDTGFRESPYVDIMCEHALTDVLKIKKVILGRDLVRILHEKLHVSFSFLSEGISVIVVGQFIIVGLIHRYKYAGMS
jgi:hypothetical protein